MSGWVPQAPTILGLGPGYSKLIHINFDSEGLENNVSWAKSAVAYTRTAIPNAGNKPGDILATAGGSLLAVAAERLTFGGTYATTLEYVKAKADHARKWGAGNCGEMSFVAFVYLLASTVRPLDIANTENGDHQFVLIGREIGGNGWGPRCTIADPWKRFAGPARDMESLNPVLYHDKDKKWLSSFLRVDDP